MPEHAHDQPRVGPESEGGEDFRFHPETQDHLNMNAA
jgi:hypothetical protein